MIDIIIVTHGNYGKELLATSELITGEQENIQTLGFTLGESVDDLKEAITNAIRHTRDNCELLILTDMRSGSPFNVTCSLMQDYKFEHITGINLPLFLEILCSREFMCLKSIKQIIMSDDMKTLFDVNELLKER